MQVKIYFAIILCLSFIVMTSFVDRLCAETPPVRVKLGIQIKSGKIFFKAKHSDSLTTGDGFQIYVKPEANCILYIIRTDENSIKLLDIFEPKSQSDLLILPSPQEYYAVGENSSVENITIICSPEKLQELEANENSDLDYLHWVKLKDRLIQESKIELSEKNKRLYSIAGNVRRSKTSQTGEFFAKHLRTYSGNGLLIKSYEFKIKE